MKKIFTFLLAVLVAASVFLTNQASAQSPEKMNYQAVIRNSSNALVKNTQIGMKISILKGAATGTVVYTETQTPTTNANGLVSIEIGGAAISAIDWADGPYFIKTETDPSGGTNYSISGTSQLLSVPYAMHAKTAEQLSEPADETDPVFEQSVAAGITSADTTKWNTPPDFPAETDPIFNAWDKSTGITITESQITDLTLFSGDSITGNEAAFIGWDKDVSDDFDGYYGSLMGRPTRLGFFRNDVGFITNPNDADADPSNELQILSISNDTIYLSNDGFVKLPAETDPVYSSDSSEILTHLRNDLDTDPTNEIQDLSTLATKTALGDSSAQVRSEIPDVSGFLTSETDPVYSSDSSGILTHLRNDLDTDPTNELQDLSTLATKTALNDSTAQVRSKIPDVSGFLTSETDPVYSSDSSGILTHLRNDLDTDPTNEIQDLSTLATKTALGDSTAQVRSEIPDVSGFLTSETDPVFTSWDKSTGISITESQISDLDHFTNSDETDPSVPTGTQTGEMQYWNGSNWVTVVPGNEGATLTFQNGIPKWIGGTSPTTFDTVIGGAGRVWMDRNLGASQVATSMDDPAAFGYLYQWGRGADGHEVRTSNTTYTLSNSDSPGHNDFILAPSSPDDWRSPQNDNLWQGLNGINNPCPSGYRLPTEAEWQAEIGSWGSNDAAAAFASSLKLPVAGYRYYIDGSISLAGTKGYYWSSTVTSIHARRLNFDSTGYNWSSFYRANGYCVRCIKD